MRRKGKITRMDRWDVEPEAVKVAPRCELKFHPSLHRQGNMYYISFYKPSKKGQTFDEIKESAFSVVKMSLDVCKFLDSYLGTYVGWCIITTPKRRHFDGFHLATQVCQVVSEQTGITFHENAVQCTNRQRIKPEFHNLLPIKEKNVIIFDDIITTGSTLKATVDAIGRRHMILNLIGINNR